MQIASQSVIGTEVVGTDGTVGTVKDVYFGSDSWRVRYLIVDTGKWLPGRRVLLAPHVIQRTNWPRNRIAVRQTRQEIEQSPPVFEHQPVSRQHEIELAQYFEWPSYWGETGPLGPTALSGIPPIQSETATDSPDIAGTNEVETSSSVDAELRSVKEVIGYNFRACDGDVGHVQELIVDDEVWLLRYLVINTNRLLPGTSILISSAWIASVSWGEREMTSELKCEVIKESPKFDPSEPINRAYEVRLYDYYGRPAPRD